MLFAAGLGKRLGSKTRNRPKALVEVAGKTLLERNLLKLKAGGFTSVIINVHHFAEQIIDLLELNRNFGMDIQISYEMEQLLETGGGLQKASWFLEDVPAFVVHNVDVLSNVPLREMMDEHLKSGALASLAVSNRKSTRYLLFDDQNQLCGWENSLTGQRILAREGSNFRKLAFSGIHVLSPAIFKLMNEQGVFSIIDVYLRLAGEHRLIAFEHEADDWFDVGTPEKLSRASRYYKSKNASR